jgi:hypothetical protein
MTLATYRALGDEELEAAYRTAADNEISAIVVEAARRDRRDAQAAADRAWWGRVSAEWHEFANAQYLAAEDECRGYLLSREGIRAGIDPWSLWSGSASRAMKYASEELRGFWDTHPRMTVSQYAWHAARPRRGENERTTR